MGIFITYILGFNINIVECKCSFTYSDNSFTGF